METKYKIFLAFVSLIIVVISFFGQYLLPEFNIYIFHFFVDALFLLILFDLYKKNGLQPLLNALIPIIKILAASFIFVSLPFLLVEIEMSIPALIAANFIFLLCILFFYYTFLKFNKLLANLLLLLAINFIFIINCFFSALLYSTGFHFEPTVLLHINPVAAKVAMDEYAVLLIGLFVFMIVLSLWARKLLKNQQEFSTVVMTLCLLAMSSNVVAISFKNYELANSLPTYNLMNMFFDINRSQVDDKKDFYRQLHYSASELAELEKLGITPQTSKPELITLEKPHNLILVYLESMQHNFTQPGGWQGQPLTPTLDTLGPQFSIFNNMYGNVTPTINAIVSSLCGIDLESGLDYSESNEVLKSGDLKMRTLLEEIMYCMPDYLHQTGYYQVFMKGAPMAFSGKGEFLMAHGYDEALGGDEINRFGNYDDRLNSWGVPDPILFKEAAKKLEQLRQIGKPFNLSMLTINSHSPGFEDPECPKYSDNVLLNGIHCTDHALAWFLDYLEQHDYYKDTVVILMGDHVMFPSSVNHEHLTMLPQVGWYDKTFFAVADPDKRLAKDVDTTAYVSDLAPSVLDLLGYGELSFLDGRSVLGSRQDYQRIVSKKFEVHQGHKSPEKPKDQQLRCTLDELNQIEIKPTQNEFSECEREKIYHAKQRRIFLFANNTQHP